MLWQFDRLLGAPFVLFTDVVGCEAYDSTDRSMDINLYTGEV